ncbi:hypothetical protein [Streptosporangium carneum]|uniref:Uncharacterized protein n=1 Tax=Streptosporangium carneum TaxID=47481 RepID=A0A9W6HYK1_9ACTN|nr:hypothetical protein [Streptosporangium carneum]GLK08467.1 hypothetical protein GCM10017600_18720 [Streptosporangium carneum]
MARLIRGRDDEVYADFGALGVFVEEDGDDVVNLESSGDHLARVRLEAWDARPPAPGDPWIFVEDTTVKGGSGFVSVGSMGEAAVERLCVGPPHFLYGVTVHTQPGGEMPEFVSDEQFEREWEEREPERWLIRFWPIRDVFDPVRHARPDRAAGRVPLPVEAPVSQAADWPAARPGRRQEAFEKWCASNGTTVADFLASAGLAPDTPFDRMTAALAQRELAAVAEREGWPEWWVELVGRYPDIVDQWHRVSGTDREWAPDRREETARALAESSRAEEILNPDGRHTFTADIQAYSPWVGGTYRGWRWDHADRPAHETFGVGRRVVHHDVMSGQVLVTGIVTVLGGGRGGKEYEVRDAEPAEAARLLCAEAVWGEDGATDGRQDG